MFRFSRSIYRELSPRVIEEDLDATGCKNRQAVLEACETTLQRLATDRRYFARPARTLFNDVRRHFSIADQRHVWQVIERNISIALEMLETTPELLELGGEPRDCRAHTRKGTPCQREPLPGRDYCPSHKHLEETFDATDVELDRLSEDLVAV